MNITHWLRKAPQPVALLADGQRIEVPKNARAWRELTSTIESLEPSKLTALDGQGNVLRSIVLDGGEAESAATPTAAMTDVQLFARLIAEAYEKGQRSNQPMLDSAMGFIDRQSTRAAKTEGEVERLRAVIYKQQMQILELTGAPAADGEESILGTILAGVAQASAAGGGGPLANLAQIKPGAAKK